MTLPDLEALATKLANGESLEVALRSLQPDDRTELLKRCAAVRQFDRALFDVLRSAPDAVSDIELDDLVGAGTLEPVPGLDAVYRLPVVDRQEYYATWWPDGAEEVIPPKLRDLSRLVLDHLATRGDSKLEALYHRLLVDPRAGLAQFADAFERADDAFDLAGCQDLLDVVVERLPLLGPEAAEVCNRHKRRLRSRAMWVRDWRRSARFLLPAPSAAATDQLIDGDDLRVLTLASDGGMGKTTYLRWLIARRCVPAGHACAFIDFDRIDPLRACQEPWLLLLEAAHQLDQQLNEAPFHELLAQYPGQRERLQRRATAASALGTNAAADVCERFVAAVRELDPAQRVVIALDTLEVALLIGGAARDQSDLVPLLEHLARVLDAPAVRIVLTARENLTTAIGEFRTLLPSSRTLGLDRFSDDEARLYLTHYRGIERRELIERIVRSAAGHPFKLELIADVAEQHPDLDPHDLDDYVDADMVYVMRRIVGRLDADQRTFLLYGVAPRVLERSFAEAVIAPLVGAESDGARRLWDGLKRYARGASWVMLDPLDIDSVRFHPSVLEPMRELLGAAQQHDELHRRAADWFEQRAVDDPADATRWLCEAVYHRFRLEGPDATGFWERQLADARVQRRPDRRRALAAEVLGEDYVVACRRRCWRDERPLLSPETELRARWELAFAAIQLAHPDYPDRREGQALEARRALKDLEHQQRQMQGERLSEGRMALVRAGLHLIEADLEAAKPHVESALKETLPREDRLWLWLAYAGAVSRRGGRHASSYFHTALRIAERSPNRAHDVPAVHLKLALHHADHDDLDRALEACAAEAGGRQAVELALVRAQIELRRGAPTAALAALPDVGQEEADVQGRCAIERVRALLAAGDPLAALRVADEAAARFGEVLQGAGDRRLAIAAEGRELRGKVHAELLHAEAAVADFEEAATRWSRLGSAEGVCRSWVRSAALHQNGLDNLHEAAVRLDQGRRTRVQRGHDAWTRCTLAGAELLHRRGESERAAELVDEALRALREENRPPRTFVAAALKGVAVTAGPAQDRFVSQLCAQLSHVTPPTARLALLDGLERCRPLSCSPELRTRLRRTVPSPIRQAPRYAGLPEHDVALLALADAELDRVAGHSERARATIAHAWRALGPTPPRATLHRLIGAAERAGAVALVEDLARRELSAIVPAESATPVLDAAALVRAAAVVSDTALRRQLLGVANELLDGLGAVAGSWPAQLLELRARDSARPEEARDKRHRAAELYTTLGDNLRRDQALGLPAPAPETVTEREVRVTVRLERDGLKVTTDRHDGARGVLQAGLDDARVGALLARPTAAQLAGRLLSDPHGLGRDLAALLREAAGTPDGGPVDLGLRAKDVELRALPWELAAPELEATGLRLFRRNPRSRGEAPDVRGIQGALKRISKTLELSPDGNLGTDTSTALAVFQEQRGLPATGRPDPETVQRLHAAVAGTGRPLVAVVRPSRRAEDRVFRGSRQSGVPVDWVYARAGFRPLVLDAPTPAELMNVLHRQPVAVLHVNAGLVDHHGTPALDLLAFPGVKGRPAGAGRLTGTALDRAIPPNLPTPLVVLDVPAPKSPREAVTQLLLRNVFAAELAAVGNVRAVISTGLARYDRQERLYDALIDSLRRGRAVAETVDAVRALAGTKPHPDDAIAFTATALFARHPSIRYPAPR